MTETPPTPTYQPVYIERPNSRTTTLALIAGSVLLAIVGALALRLFDGPPPITQEANVSLTMPAYPPWPTGMVMALATTPPTPTPTPIVMRTTPSAARVPPSCNVARLGTPCQPAHPTPVPTPVVTIPICPTTVTRAEYTEAVCLLPSPTPAPGTLPAPMRG